MRPCRVRPINTSFARLPWTTVLAWCQAVPPEVREYIQFPPFEHDHLDNSLHHLSNLVAYVWRR